MSSFAKFTEKRKWKYPQTYVGSSMQMKKANFSYQVHISPLNIDDEEIEVFIYVNFVEF